MHVVDELVPILKRLRMSGVLETLELRSQQAVDDKLSHEEFLYRLLCDEVERREMKQLQQRMRRAQFEQHKTLEEFNFTFNPQLPKEQMIELGTCKFVAKRENVALIGPSGVGKSHIAQALGHRACMRGYSVQFMNSHSMFMMLRAARADESYERKLQKLVSVELLVLDDLGLRPLRVDEQLDLYELFRQRYERGSLVITSNRAIEEWYPMFSDALLASAALDRYLHHAHVLTMEGHSYRNPPKEGSDRG